MIWCARRMTDFLDSTVEKATEALVAAAAKGRLAVLAGAGISIPSGIPGSREIRDYILSGLFPEGAPSDVQSLPLEVIVANLGSVMRTKLMEVFRSGAPTYEHFAIASLWLGGCVRELVTTNFDELIEGATSAFGGAPSRVPSGPHRSDPYVVHLHGRASDQNSIRLAVDDVVRGQRRLALQRTLLRLFSKEEAEATLVLGYSFSDEFDINPTLREMALDPCLIVALDHDEDRLEPKAVSLDEVLQKEMWGRLPGLAIQCDTGVFLSSLLSRLSLSNGFPLAESDTGSVPLVMLRSLEETLAASRDFYKAILRFELTEAAWWRRYDGDSDRVEFPDARLSDLSRAARSPEDVLIAHFVAANARSRRIARLRVAQFTSELPPDVSVELTQMRGRHLEDARACVGLLPRISDPTPLLQLQCLSLLASCLVDVQRTEEGLEIANEAVHAFRGRVPSASLARLLCLIGNIYRIKGRSQLALSYLREADEIFLEEGTISDSSTILPALCELYVAAGRGDEAEEARKRFVSIHRGNLPTFVHGDDYGANLSWPRDGAGAIYPILSDAMPDLTLNP